MSVRNLLQSNSSTIEHQEGLCRWRTMVRFESVAYDTATIKNASGSYHLFQEERLINERPVNRDNPEKQVVEWLVSHLIVRNLFFSTLGFRQVNTPLLWIPRKSFEKAPIHDGDFDLLCYQPDRFEELTSIEFKVIKVEEESPEGYCRINGLGKIDKLINQGNTARRTGFRRTFVATVALLNLSNIPHQNVFTKTSRAEGYSAVYDIRNFGTLDSEVGYILIELVQTTGKDWRKSGQMNMGTLKPPSAQIQHWKTTRDFKDIYFRQAIKIAH